MIFSLDDSLLESKQLKEMAKFLVTACENEQKIECSANVWDFLEKKVLINDYIGKLDIELVKSNESLYDISTVYRNAFTSVKVGIGAGMIDVDKAYRIVSLKSRVVLENSSNDWPTINKWIELFDSKINTTHKTVNSMVRKAVMQKRLVQDHAGGGNGTIAVRMQSLIDESYGYVEKYKLTTVFDSDKTSVDDDKEHNKSLLDFLNAHQINGHELVKRELENYYSWDAYTAANKTSSSIPPTEVADEYDYRDIAKCDNIILKKCDMQDMPQFMNHKRLIQRIQNNIGKCGGEYEIQQIILMFAKVI